MSIRITAVILGTLVCTACNKPVQKEYDSSLIDKQKVNHALGNNISKILLDHIYVVVDSATYSSITSNNHFKTRYAALDTGLPDFTPVVTNSSTCYLRGHQHSIEILGPSNTYNEPVGKSGIGFSLKNKGEHFHLGITPKLTTHKDTVLHASETVKMTLGAQNPTWFKAFYTPSLGTALHTWYGFYNPAFLDELHGTTNDAYTREAYLSKAYAEDKLFNSIESIRLSCTAKDFQRIAQELGYLKCTLTKNDGETYTIKSGDIQIILEFSKQINYSRITQIKCTLNKEDHSLHQLGNLTIKNQGKRSTWDFNALHTSILKQP